MTPNEIPDHLLPPHLRKSAPAQSGGGTLGGGTGLDQFFTIPDRATTPRLAVSIEGLDKRGKTYWSLVTAPAPILVISDDPGTMDLAQKLRRQGKDIRIMEVTYPPPDPNVIRTVDVNSTDFNKWKGEWERVRTAARSVIPAKQIRTLVFDTGGGLWDLCVLAHFGKLKKAISQELRAECNAEYSGLFWELYKGRLDLNLIYIHKVKKRYVKTPGTDKGDWDGTYERSGYNMMSFLVDVSLVTNYDGMRRMFYTELDMSQPTRYGAHLAGKKWYGTESTFYNLGFDLFPETELTPEVWGVGR